jgi:hypothetical protein
MTRKLDTEHLNEIQSLREEFTKNTNILGQIAIERYSIETRLTQLRSDEQQLLTTFDALQQQEQALLEKMRNRYGEGQINIADGTFTPTE